MAALASGLVLPAKADLILSPFGDIPKNGTGIGGGNSNNQANNFFRLQNYIAAHPTFGSLGTPIVDGAERVSSPLDDPVDLTGFCYAVVHYGVGRGGVPGTGGRSRVLPDYERFRHISTERFRTKWVRRDLQCRSLPMHAHRRSGCGRDCDVARGGPWCAWYGAAVLKDLAAPKGFRTQEWSSILGGHSCSVRQTRESGRRSALLYQVAFAAEANNLQCLPVRTAKG